MNDCIWEDGKFKGKSDNGFYYELEADKVAKPEALRLKLSYGKKDVDFKIEKVAGGFYSALWTWEIDGEGYKDESKPYANCAHVWINQGFQHIVMACKHCGELAPNWVLKKG